MELSWAFLCGVLSIVVIDLILAGDNAVVIAMAVRTLPSEKQKWGIVFGAGAAVALRVVFTFFVAQLLQISFLKIAGGLVIAWIAVKLLFEDLPREAAGKESKDIWHAVWIIMVADVSMALDNMLAVAGASGGNLFLLVFGLGLSIPLVVCASTLLVKLMDKYPVIIYIGAAVLGKVAGEMIITDPYIIEKFAPGVFIKYLTEIIFAAGVILGGRFLAKRHCSKK